MEGLPVGIRELRVLDFGLDGREFGLKIYHKIEGNLEGIIKFGAFLIGEFGNFDSDHGNVVNAQRGALIGFNVTDDSFSLIRHKGRNWDLVSSLMRPGSVLDSLVSCGVLMYGTGGTA